MNKLMLLICMWCLPGVAVYAQFYSGVKPQIVFPVKSSEVDWGVGPDLQLGYSLTQKVDLEIGAGKLWFKSMLDDNYHIQSVKANARYYISGTSARPYVGFGLGYFKKTFEGPFNTSFEDNAIGVMPSAGVAFDFKSVKRLSMITELAYNYIDFNRRVTLLSIGVGLKYNFSGE